MKCKPEYSETCEGKKQRAQYNKIVQRLLAILLLSVINFPLIAPLAVAQGKTELPLCCRKTGKHKCALERVAHAAPSGHAGFSIADRCPFTAASKEIQASPHRPLVSGFCQSFEQTTTILTAAYFESFRPVRLEQAHHKRGPPTLLI